MKSTIQKNIPHWIFRTDCRPKQFKTEEFIKNTCACNSKCPYYKLCLDEMGRRKLSNTTTAIYKRFHRAKKKLSIHENN